MVTVPPQVAVTFPAMSVDVRFVICHFSSEQLEIFGSPFTVDDAQVPEKTELLDDDDEDEEDEEEDDEDDPDDPPPVEGDAFVLDGAVGKSVSDLLWKPQAATSVKARTEEAISAEVFISVPYTFVFALTVSCARTYENSSKCVKCLRSSGLVQNAGQCLNVYRPMFPVR
jgi:hypothetical protein